MQKLAVVYFPKTNLDIINYFREKYDIGWQIIPPHITIVSPLAGITERQLVEHVEIVTQDITSFTIDLTGLSKTPDNCLFLLVKKGKEHIINLHNRLYSGILAPQIPTRYPFIPHVTLGDFGIGNANLCTKVLIEAQNIKIKLTDNFNTISLIKGDGINPATTIKSVKLG